MVVSLFSAVWPLHTRGDFVVGSCPIFCSSLPTWSAMCWPHQLPPSVAVQMLPPLPSATLSYSPQCLLLDIIHCRWLTALLPGYPRIWIFPSTTLFSNAGFTKELCQRLLSWCSSYNLVCSAHTTFVFVSIFQKLKMQCVPLDFHFDPWPPDLTAP